MIRHILFRLIYCGVLAVGSAYAEPLRVGVILPLSGDATSIGTAFKNGMELALEEQSVEDRGRVQFFFEDDALNPVKSVSALQRLLSEKKVETVINISSGTGNSIAPILESKKVAFIAVASDPQIVRGRQYAFNFWVTPDEEARVLIPEAIRRGYKKIARVTATHPGAYSARDAFDRKNNGQIGVELDEEFAPDAKDFKTYLTKVRARKDIDALHPILFPGQLSAFTKQARSMGLTQPFFGWEFFEDSNEVKISEGTLVGSWYANADDASGDFMRRYQNRFPNASLYGAANGHDTVLLLVEAMKVGKKGSEGVREYLATLKGFQGALGSYSASGDNRFTLKAAVKVVTSTSFEKIR